MNRGKYVKIHVLVRENKAKYYAKKIKITGKITLITAMKELRSQKRRKISWPQKLFTVNFKFQLQPTGPKT